MGGEWHESSVADLCDIFLGGTPKRSEANFWGGSIKWASAKDVASCSTRHIRSTEENITQEGLQKSAAKLLDKGTIVITARGTVGSLCILGEKMSFNQTCYGLVANKSIDGTFLYYSLKHAINQIKSLSYGTVFDTITMKTFRDITVPTPPLPEQQAIAHILGSLDDKIELNREMNETLEEMARTIFKSWFVDFDPVKAKMEGRDTRLPKEIADLFPDRFVESELGLIPEGWEVKKLGDIANVNWGDTSVTKKSYTEDGFLAYSAKGPDGFLPYYDYDRTGVILSAIGANSGHTWIAHGKWSCIKNTIRFWSIDPSISTEYLFHATLGKHKWPLRGSAQPFISQKDSRNLKIVYPKNNLAKLFGDYVNSFYKKTVSNMDQIKLLTSIRDTLLPKLISGELRVPEAEKIAEEYT